MNGSSAYPIRTTINGKHYSLEVPPHQTLLRVLRDRLMLTGSKPCCEEGECGACTVLFNGRAVNSCLILAVEVDGGEILTIEGLSHHGELDPLQQAFIDEGAVQCGYCTPGMIMAAKYLLMDNPHPSLSQIQQGLAGNLCRCTGYGRIIRAVQRAASTLAES